MADTCIAFYPGPPKERTRNLRAILTYSGISPTWLSRDRHGNPTARVNGNRNNELRAPITKNIRRLRLISMYVELMYTESGIRSTKPTRAVDDPLVMLEVLVAKCLREAAMPSATSRRHKSSS